MENNIRVNPLKYPNEKCKCGCEVWNQGFILKRIPGLELGTGTEDQFIDLPVYYCSKCGEILPQYREIYKLDEPKDKEQTTEMKPKLII